MKFRIEKHSFSQTFCSVVASYVVMYQLYYNRQCSVRYTGYDCSDCGYPPQWFLGMKCFIQIYPSEILYHSYGIQRHSNSYIARIGAVLS